MDGVFGGSSSHNVMPGLSGVFVRLFLILPYILFLFYSHIFSFFPSVYIMASGWCFYGMPECANECPECANECFYGFFFLF